MAMKNIIKKLMITTNEVQKVLKTFDKQLFKQLKEMQLSLRNLLKR